jgi:hypothetical protein
MNSLVGSPKTPAARRGSIAPVAGAYAGVQELRWNRGDSPQFELSSIQ